MDSIMCGLARHLHGLPAKLLIIGVFLLSISAWLPTPGAKAAELPVTFPPRLNAEQATPWVTIGSRLWLEDDNDGNATTGQVVSVGAGHIVRATATDSGVIYTGVTDANGNYAIAVPAFATYLVTADPIPGYSDSPVLVTDGSNPASNNNRNHQRTGTTVVMTDVDNLSIDFGFYHHAKMVQLGDRLWLEDDNDGDATTGTVVSVGAGHLVTAVASDNVTTYTGVTDANGYYLIPVPEYDTYRVTTALPTGAGDTPVWTTYGYHPSQFNNKNHDRTGTAVTMDNHDNLSIDFGFTRPTRPPMVSLGNYVWLDSDGNGAQNEPPSAGQDGITVTLTHPSGALSTTVTANGGYYYFANLQPNQQYTVQFTLPAGYAFTQPNQGDDTLDSDTPTNGTVTVNLGTQDDLTIDAGLVVVPPPLVALGDRVWLDANLDGQQNDAHDPIVAGLAVTLLNVQGQPIQSTTTNASGYYSFTNLLPGDYGVAVQLPVGYGVTTGGDDPDTNPANTDSNAIADGNRMVSRAVTLATDTEPLHDNLTQGGNDASGNGTVDFGLIKLVRLGDWVWADTNGNGQQDQGEPGLPNVQVSLRYPDNTVSTTTTDAQGVYTFTNLLPNTTYVVTFATPIGYLPTSANMGSDVTDSDPLNGQVTVTLGASDDLTIDAGFIRPALTPASLGDLVWEDSNGNGRQESGEPPIANVTVVLTGADGSMATTTTDAHGIYTFTNLIPGLSYTVTFATPTGYTPTTANSGADDTVDSDGLTVVVPPLQPGQHNPTFDSGFVRLLPTLRLSKQVMTAPGLIQPGAVVTYSLRYINVGNGPAVGVVITETVSAYTKFFAQASRSGWGCADGATAGTLCRFLIGDLQPGQSGEVIFAVKVDLGVTAGTSLINAAVISFEGVAGVAAEATSTIAGPTNLPVTPEPGQINQRLFLPLVTR